MSSDSPSGQSTTIQNSEPWAAQQPYLETGFKKAEEQLNKPMEYYPNSTVVPFSNQTSQALDMYENRATAGSPLTQTAQNTVLDTTRGKFLDGGNPYLQNAINTAAQPVTENFMKSVMPSTNAAFSSAGRYGSGMHASAMDTAQQNLGRSLSDMAGSMAYQNYGDERNRQMAAASISPQLAQADYADIGQLERVGQIRENRAGAELQDDISRFNFGQQAERDALAQYQALIAGGSFGGTSTSTSPIYRNSVGEALGAGALGVGIAGGLFGGGGLFPGFLKG